MRTELRTIGLIGRFSAFALLIAGLLSTAFEPHLSASLRNLIPESLMFIILAIRIVLLPLRKSNRPIFETECGPCSWDVIRGLCAC